MLTLNSFPLSQRIACDRYEDMQRLQWDLCPWYHECSNSNLGIIPVYAV